MQCYTEITFPEPIFVNCAILLDWAYILILVDNVHSTDLHLSFDGEISPHRGADKDVIKPITVDVTGGNSVAKIGTDLFSRQIV